MSTKGVGVLGESEPLKIVEFDRRALKNDDIHIKIMYVGVCHSDWHHIHNDWKDSKYPMVPGHEIVGQVLTVGVDVVKFKPGQAVAVGTIVDSCMKCKNCHKSQEQYCLNTATETYNGNERLPNELGNPTGPITFGGWSTDIVVKEHFVFDISHIDQLERAAPLLCAGITVYAPLKQFKAGRGHKIGVAGIGGLGHMAVKFAKAFGAKVVALTTTEWKLEDSRLLGADDAVLVSEMEVYEGKLDLILCTIPTRHNLEPYLKLLKTGGCMYILGALEPLEVHGGTLSWNNLAVKSSQVGGVHETQEMIDFCHYHDILPDVQIIEASDLQNTFDGLVERKVRYRYIVDASTI